MRLIDADALKECIKKRLRNGMIIGWLFSIIDETPTIEVEPVKHGKWVSAERRPMTFYECSLCNDRWNYGAVIHMNYCPNCGAKMDLEEQDDG